MENQLMVARIYEKDRRELDIILKEQHEGYCSDRNSHILTIHILVLISYYSFATRYH